MTGPDKRGLPETMRLHPGQRYQFRGVFSIEHSEREPVEITWQRVEDDPYEQDLGREARLQEELDALRARVVELESGRAATLARCDEIDKSCRLVHRHIYTQTVRDLLDVERGEGSW